MLSSLVLISLMPLQVAPSGNLVVPMSRPLAVAAFIDSAKILGLPKFKLRDANGALYIAHKAMLQEPLATVHQHAGEPIVGDVSMRKAYINSYVRRSKSKEQ